MPKFVIEFVDSIDVAFSEYSGEGASEKANGPLIDLFFKAAKEAYLAESGDTSIEKSAYDRWLFATQFHLPPNVRWLGVRRAPLGPFGPATDYEFWLAYGERMAIPQGTKVKKVVPGLYATLTLNFKGRDMFDPQAINDGWEQLLATVKEAGIAIDSRQYIEEHLQKINEGGWGGMKLMVPIKPETLPKGIKNGLYYVMPRKPK